MPIALPGMLRKVPGWLLDPLGPLSVRPSYFPRALPWLLRWIEAGRLHRVMAISDAMRALHRETLACWQELLGRGAVPRADPPVRPGAGVGGRRRYRQRSHGAANARASRHRPNALNADDLRQMFPGIAREITRGLLIPGNGYTISPQRSVHSLADLFRPPAAR